MQNTQVNDLVNGTGKREGFSNLVYLRKDSQVRIQEVTQAGYVLVEQGNENQDMSLYGLPEGKDVTQSEVKA